MNSENDPPESPPRHQPITLRSVPEPREPPPSKPPTPENPEKPPRPSEGNARLGMLLAFGVLAVGVVMVFVLTRPTDQATVVIKADSLPFKVRPVDPGGVQLDNLDSPVLGLLDGGVNIDELPREILTPEEETPAPPPIPIPETAPQAVSPQAETEPLEVTPLEVPPLAEVDEPAIPQLEPEPILAEQATPEQATPDEQPEPTETGAETPEITESAEPEEQPAETAIALPQPRPAGASPPTATTPQTEDTQSEIDAQIAAIIDPDEAPAPQAVAQPRVTLELGPECEAINRDAGEFAVQFAAFRREQNAQDATAVLSRKHESRLCGIVVKYTRIGEYWHVLTESITRQGATVLCTRLRSVGQDCIVKQDRG